jgi:hypothetical protein
MHLLDSCIREGHRILTTFRNPLAEFREICVPCRQQYPGRTQNPNYVKKFLGRVQKYMHLLDSSIRAGHRISTKFRNLLAELINIGTF